MKRQEFETLVKNAIAWARRRESDPLKQAESLEWLAGSGMIVPGDMQPLNEAIRRLRAS